MSIAIIERLEQKDEPELRSLVLAGGVQTRRIFDLMVEGSSHGEDTFSMTHPLGRRLLELARVRATMRDIWIERIIQGLKLCTKGK